MGITWTKAQQKVIDTRNRNILVSAAAGSGKTAVLVARILDLIMDLDSPCNIDEMIIVTFTKAAAGEMRERIIRAFEEKLDKDPGNAHLEKQIALIHQAQITTIHGFCKNIIDHHFYLLDLEPGFRIGEEAEIELLKKDVLDQVLVDAYNKGEDNFYAYIDRYAPGKNDLQIEEQIKKLYAFMMGNPFPDLFMKECVEKYECNDIISSGFYFKESYDYVIKELKYGISILEQGIEVCNEDSRLEKYANTLNCDLDGIIHLCNAKNYEELSHAFSIHSFSKLGTVRSFEGDDNREYVKELRSNVKDLVNDLKESYFFMPSDRTMESIANTKVMVKELIHLTQSFSKAYQAEKKRRNIIDFNDLEHFALQILVDSQTRQPSDTAKKIQEQYQYIMIDEYQDSNLVQEIILNSIARKDPEPKNIFMVGDVKQSIYRFRLARPELFMEKYDRYGAEDESGVTGQRINLHQNFRSRTQVIDLVNSIFRQIMKKDLGGIEYNKDAELVPGADYPINEEADFLGELILVNQDTKIELASSAQKEGLAIAQTIYRILEDNFVTDSETKELRKPRFSDIVILSRSLSNWAEPVKEVLEDCGIPVFSSLTTGYFSALEIQTILSMLHLIDNFMQDIPLVTVMTSEMYQFTKEELAQIKAAAPKKFFHQSVLECFECTTSISGDLREKIAGFFAQIQSYQKLATIFSIHELIQRVLDDTLYLDCVTAMPKGNIRKMNLLMLIEKAKQFENTSYKGVFHFLRYMERLEKYEIDFGTASISGESDNVVRLMSTHKSKGLEFPIVIVANLGKSFNLSDQRDSLVLHPNLGIGLADIDSDRRIKRETISKNLMKDYLGIENTGEELRILYVALTRAKEKLYMIGGMKRLDSFTDKYERKAGFANQLNYLDIKDARSPLHWIYPVALSNNSFCKIKIINPDKTLVLEEMELYKKKISQDFLEQEPHSILETIDKIEELDQRFSYEYPYKNELGLKGKMSVSEIKHRFMEMRYEESKMELIKPSFLEEETEYMATIPNFIGETQKENMGAFYGTAIHRYLELLDYKMIEEFSHIDLHSAQMILIDDFKFKYEAGLISEKQKSVLVKSVYSIYEFCICDLGMRMCEAAIKNQLVREQPFVMGLTPLEAGLDNSSEARILVQGIMDAYFEEENSLVLVDYKTDKVSSEEDLIKRYQKQMELYKTALERGTNQSIKEVILYSFSLQKPVIIL